jgi:bifunctional non-homologous end joining protein LigD
LVSLGPDPSRTAICHRQLARERNGELEFAGPAILNPPQALRTAWRERMAALAVTKPPVRGLRQGTAQWLKPELRVRVRHLKAKGTLRHATVKGLMTD